jgi:hypothetical protein
MTERTITKEELKAVLTATEHINTYIFSDIMTAAFPPKFVAYTDQVISVSDIEGDFSGNIFRKFMHMENGRYQCLGNSRLHEGKYYHWSFARALTSEELGGAEVDGSNLVPDVTVDGSDLELGMMTETSCLNGALWVLEARLDKLEKAPSQKFAIREQLTRLVSIIRDLEVADNDSDSNALLSHYDRVRLDNLYTEILP